MAIVAGHRIPLHPRHVVLTPYPKAPGEFRWEDESYHASEPPAQGQRGRFNYGCPRGTGTCGAIVVFNGPKPDSKKVWGFDGDAEHPTLTPSINCLTHHPETKEPLAGCGWHGYVEKGNFRDA